MTQYIVTNSIPLGDRFTDKGDAIKNAMEKTVRSKINRYVLEIVGVSRVKETPAEFVPMPDPLTDQDLDDND